MKNILIIFLLALPMMAFSQSQMEMNATAAANYRKADKDLNVVYQSVMKKHAKDAVFLKSMKAAQKAWIVFRNADMVRANGNCDYLRHFKFYHASSNQQIKE